MININLALVDFTRALRNHRLWLYLGWSEVRLRYRNSTLGPWWITLSMLIFILAMSVVFSQLFKQNLADYIPFFTAGYLFWSLISGTISEAPEAFRSCANFITQIKLPFSIYILKHLTKHVGFLAHNFIVYGLVMLYFHISPGINFLLIFPATVILLLNLYWISLFIALISTRYRDMSPIIQSCVQIAFFITPISWAPKLLAAGSRILQYNPFAYLIDLVRDPLLGVTPALDMWLINIGFVIIGMGMALLLFARYHARIPFWVN